MVARKNVPAKPQAAAAKASANPAGERSTVRHKTLNSVERSSPSGRRDLQGPIEMIRECLAHALPEPDFAQRGGEFTIAVWRDWLTAEVLAGFHLNERQLQAVRHAKVTGRINNAQYRDLTGTSERTALRELRQLTSIGIFDKVGGTGQSAHYAISKAKPVIGEQGGNPS